MQISVSKSDLKHVNRSGFILGREWSGFSSSSPQLRPSIPNSEYTHSHGQGAGFPVFPHRSEDDEDLPAFPHEWRGASRWPLAHTAAVYLRVPAPVATRWFMWSDLLLSVTSDLWTSWNEPRGEGGKVTEGCLKEKLHTSTLWKAKHIIFCSSSIIFSLPGHLVGRKTVNWWQPWNTQLERLCFFNLQVGVVEKKGIRN